jgi:hypothetical protein
VPETCDMRSPALHGTGRQEWDAAVGRLLSEAAEAEARLSFLLRALSGTESATAAYLLPRAVPAMVGLVRDLLALHVRDHRLRDDFLRWAHAVERLCALRTTIVHTAWDLRDEGGRPVMHAVWSSDDEDRHPRTAAELVRTTAAVTRLLAAPADDLLLRLDKAVPHLGVFTRG